MTALQTSQSELLRTQQAGEQSSEAATEDASQQFKPVDMDAHLRVTIDQHLHPEHGSPYWWKRQEQLGIDVRDRVRTIADLPLLGLTHPADLASESVWNFLPRCLWNRRCNCLVGESGGTTGQPVATTFLTANFQAAFVSPFLHAAMQTNFPFGAEWLWVGPSGPHIIGKVVGKLAAATNSPDPWSVDFDPRWVKKLIPGSFAAKRYLAHVIDQAVDVMQRQAPEVLFTTPPVLDALAERLDDAERSRFRGVHYGGMAITSEQINRFRELYPNAVHLSGYGNSLCGVAMEIEDRPRTSIDYFPRGARLIYGVVKLQSQDSSWASVQPGERGRVLFHRMDDSAFLPNMLERDEATLILPTPAGYANGWTLPGLRDPAPPVDLAVTLKTGLY